MKKLGNIGVIGLGYVGLTLAAVLSERGFRVIGVDTDKSLVEKLNKGEPHFYEKGLPLAIKKSLGKGLFFDNCVPSNQDAFILCVGTPIDKKTKAPILTYVEDSAKQIVNNVDDGNLIVLRSTVPIGATRNIVKPILDKSGKKYSLSFCPERTIEGKALEELKGLPQIIGGVDEDSVDLSFDLFKRVTNTIIKMSSLESAEMVKLLCNSYRDIVFAYANEIALICEKIKLDPNEVISAANSGYDRAKIPSPGFVGGLCLQKDPYILSECISKTDYVPKIITKGREMNEYLVDYVLGRVKGKTNAKDKVFVSGLAFKGRPETDDVRASPSAELVDRLKMEGYNNIHVHDFVVGFDKLKSLGYLPVNLEEGFRGARCVLIGNNNEKYSYIDIDKYVGLMERDSLFFDIWNIFDSKFIERNGITYAGIGK